MKVSERFSWRVRAVLSAAAGALFVAIIAFGFMLGIGPERGNNGDMTYHSLDYDATVTQNGDLRLVEHMDIDLGKRPDDGGDKVPWRELYQNYKLDDKQLSAITNVSVKDGTGKEYSYADRPASNDLKYSDDTDWDSDFAETWYAVNTSCNPAAPYSPAGGKKASKDPVDGIVGAGRMQGAMDGLGAQGSPGTGSNGSTNTNGSTGVTGQGASYVEPSRSSTFSTSSKPATLSAPQVRSAADNDLKEDGCSSGQSGDTIEIGWNIPATYTAKHMKFDVTMTFKDVVTLYDDVAYLKWEPVADDNPVPIESLHAKVSLPKAKGDATSTSKAKATSVSLPQQWLHFAGSGHIEAQGQNTIDLTAKDINPHQHVDLISMSSAAPMGKVAHTKSGDHAQAVVHDENVEHSKWMVGQVANIVWLVVSILAVIGAFAYAIRQFSITSRKAADHDEIDYYRDIPEITPVAAARLMEILEGSAGSRLMGMKSRSRYEGKMLSRQMAATLLSLLRKGLIAIYPGASEWYVGLDLSRVNSGQLAERVRAHPSSEAEKTSTIVVLPAAYVGDRDGETLLDQMAHGSPRSETQPEPRTQVKLTRAEGALLELLKSFAAYNGSRVFDLKEMRKQGKKWTDGPQYYKAFRDKEEEEFEAAGLAYSQGPAITKAVGGMVVAALIAGLYIWHTWSKGGVPWVVMVLAVVVVFAAIMILNLMPSEALNEDGRKIADQVLGLRKYMEDFSDFSDRGPQDLALWDDYLIYATALGVSSEFVRKLAEVQPSLTDQSWLDQYASGSVLYWVYCGPAWSGAAASAGPSFGSGAGFGGFGDLGSQLSSGFSGLGTSFSGGIGGGGGAFGGSGGGAGGGSFGGR